MKIGETEKSRREKPGDACTGERARAWFCGLITRRRRDTGAGEGTRTCTTGGDDRLRTTNERKAVKGREAHTAAELTNADRDAALETGTDRQFDLTTDGGACTVDDGWVEWGGAEAVLDRRQCATPELHDGGPPNSCFVAAVCYRM